MKPIKNIKKTFFVKNKYKEKTYRKNKFKMSVIMYLENKEKKNKGDEGEPEGSKA